MARTTATTLAFVGDQLAAQLLPLVPPRQQSAEEWSCRPQATYEPCEAIKAGLCLPATCEELVRRVSGPRKSGSRAGKHNRSMLHRCI